MSIRLGYQMPNFNYGTTVDQLFPTVVAQAKEAEKAGFDAAFVMDHFYQLPGIGKPDEPMLESYTALAGIAAATETIQLSALVTGNTYRNPPMLAKTVTTLDVVSQGRAVLGIGAGWFELEHNSFGYEFGTFTERFEKLEEALQIIGPMLHGQRPTFAGKYYHVDNAMNEPRIRDDLPILLGGGGEKKTFRMAAQYADHLNIICSPSELPRKLDAVAQRCAEVGRDRSTLEVSFLASVILDETDDLADQALADATGSADRKALAERVFSGGPESVAAQIKERVLDKGADGVIVNMVANGHKPGIVALAGAALSPLVR